MLIVTMFKKSSTIASFFFLSYSATLFVILALNAAKVNATLQLVHLNLLAISIDQHFIVEFDTIKLQPIMKVVLLAC